MKKDFNDLKMVEMVSYQLVTKKERETLKSKNVEFYLFEDVTDNKELENETISENNRVKGFMYQGESFLVYPNYFGDYVLYSDYQAYKLNIQEKEAITK